MMATKIEWAGQAWRPIPGYPQYYASRDGQILSLKSKYPLIMKQMTSADGYKHVFMYVNGKMKKMRVHRAVLLSWKGLPEKGQEGRHLNDNPEDNEVDNLEWGTRLQNVNDKRINGGLPIGERSGSHKLTEQQVIEIKGLYGKKSLRELGAMYGVSHTCIRRAALGIKWAHLKEEASI